MCAHWKSKSARPWSTIMVGQLKNLADHNTYVEDIALRMNMTVPRVKAKMIQHGFHIISKPKA